VSIWTDVNDIDFKLKFVDAAGIPTRALQSGNGEPLLFLHGTSGHLEAFTRNMAAHAERYACHAIDMLGHGYTGKPDYPYEIPRYVEHVRAYLAAEGIDRVHIAGESLGGWVGAWLASEEPERVLSLQLIAAGGTKANPQVMKRIHDSTLEAVHSDRRDLTRQRLLLLMHDPANVTEELVDVRYRIYHQPAFQRNVHNLLCLQDMETRQRNLLRQDRLACLTMPTLVIWGQQNPFGDVPEAHAINEAIAGSRLELFPECGHWPQYEHAELYNPLSLTFLGACGAAS